MSTNFFIKNLTSNSLYIEPEAINVEISPYGAFEVDPLNLIGNYYLCKDLGDFVEDNRIVVYRGTAIYNKASLLALGGSATHVETLEGSDVEIGGVDTVEINYDQEDKGTSSEYFKVSRKTGSLAVPYITCTGDGTFLVSPEGEIRLSDGNQTGWTQGYITLSDNGSEWTDYKSTFGEVSILNSIKQSYDAAGAGGTASDWGYLDAVGPSDGVGGNITPTLVYQFDGSSDHLNERVSGSINLSADPYISSVPLSFLGVTHGQSTPVYTTTLTDAERAVGAVTAELIVSIYNAADRDYLFAIASSGESLATNFLFSLRLMGSIKYNFASLVEAGSGSPEDAFDYNCVPPVGIPMYVCLTRASDGVTYKLYLNGILKDTVVSSVVPEISPTSNSQQLGLLGYFDGGATLDGILNGCISSFRLTVGNEFSQAQVTETWNAVKPSS